MVYRDAIFGLFEYFTTLMLFGIDNYILVICRLPIVGLLARGSVRPSFPKCYKLAILVGVYAYCISTAVVSLFGDFFIEKSINPAITNSNQAEN